MFEKTGTRIDLGFSDRRNEFPFSFSYLGFEGTRKRLFLNRISSICGGFISFSGEGRRCSLAMGMEMRFGRCRYLFDSRTENCKKCVLC